MKRTLRNISTSLIGKIPMSGFYLIVKRDVIGFFYHMVSNKAVPHTRHLYPHRDVDIFEQDLIFIKENFTVLSFDELRSKRYSQANSRSPAVFLSFDDGFSECFSVARPLLLKHELPCSFFFTTNFIDNQQMYYRNKVSLCIDRLFRLQSEEMLEKLVYISELYQTRLKNIQAFIRWIKSITDDGLIDEVSAMLDVDIDLYLSEHKPYMSVEEIRTMAAEGFTIGAHSKKHQKLGRLSEVEIEKEIVGSIEIVQRITGSDFTPFSFPNTATGIDRNFLERILQAHPYVGLFFDAKGLETDREFVQNRIWVESPKLNAGGAESLRDVIETVYNDYLIQGMRRMREVKR